MESLKTWQEINHIHISAFESRYDIKYWKSHQRSKYIIIKF